MHVRRKKNRSGTISVVVVSKAHGRYREIKGFGASDSEEKISALVQEAESWLRSYEGQQDLDFEDFKGRELEETKRVIDNMDAVLINGTQLLLNLIYDSTGFNRIPDEILRHLV
ncbi:MAG: transposase, partial [Tannerellaceae bacterium]|nr:transposase [Tannerellaceae bacterium]